MRTVDFSFCSVIETLICRCEDVVVLADLHEWNSREK
jgi:hypothetical protein